MSRMFLMWPFFFYDTDIFDDVQVSVLELY